MVGRLFATNEIGVQPVKIVVEIESDLVTHYKNKLKADDFPILDPFKITRGWMKDEGIEFWQMLSYPDIR